MSFSSICRTSSPLMASPNSSWASSTALGSSKCVAAFTTAFARVSGSLDLKMPDPTNTASAPRRRTSAASAGVAMPPAEKFGTGSLPVLAIWRISSRSEEHTSELQSQSNLVCRLLLEKKIYPLVLLMLGAHGCAGSKGCLLCHAARGPDFASQLATYPVISPVLVRHCRDLAGHLRRTA